MKWKKQRYRRNMEIRKALRREFPGVCALIDALVCIKRAYFAYEKAIHDMEVLKIRNYDNAWIWNVFEHSELSYADALSIYEFLIEHPKAFGRTMNETTEHIIEMANNGVAVGDILWCLRLRLE